MAWGKHAVKDRRLQSGRGRTQLDLRGRGRGHRQKQQGNPTLQAKVWPLHPQVLADRGMQPKAQGTLRAQPGSEGPEWLDLA